MSASSKWEDLAPRLLSGAFMAVVGLVLVTFGSPWLDVLAAVVVGVMTSELAHLTAPARRAEALILGLVASGLLLTVFYLHRPFPLALMAVVPFVGALRPRHDRIVFAVYGTALALTGYGVVAFREGLGLGFVLWLVFVVVASDILGYFGGRIIGGPKFWPRISPKKTWSGTLSGWAGAMVVGVVAWGLGGAPGWIVVFSPLVALAAQMGDICESLIKRRAGVKDASALIPGHGGFLDRFDGLIGAVMFLLLWAVLLPLPDVGG
jgi:phosphatidate cytidylyltransferase